MASATRLYPRTMFLLSRLLSHSQSPPPLLLAAIAFAIGLGAGATIGPVTASRSANEAQSGAAIDRNGYIAHAHFSHRASSGRAARAGRRHVRGAGASVARARCHHA